MRVSCSVLRSRRPQDTPRNFIHENRETSEMPAAKLGRRTAGEGSSHTARMHVPEESDSGILPMSHSNKDGKPLAESEEGRLLITEQHSSIWRAPDTERGLRVFHGWASVRTSCTLGRYSFVIRAACANERSCGSVRGAISNGRPYRDLTTW